MCAHTGRLPKFTVADRERADVGGVDRLRVYVSLADEDLNRAGAVARAVTIDQIHPADSMIPNDVVLTLIYTDGAAITRDAADLVALYIADGVPNNRRPPTPKGARSERVASGTLWYVPD